MLDLYSPLTPDAQLANRAAYREFLVKRDGVPDIDKRTLSRREEDMVRYARPLSRLRELDERQFREQLQRFSRKRKMSPEALLLLALVTLNSAEAYGVSTTFDMVYRRAMAANDDVELLLFIEEMYHTRILLSATLLFGVELTEPAKPPLFLRGMISAIVRAPEAVSRPLVLAGEIVGALMCLSLLQAAGQLLQHDPELRDANEERVLDVLIDEIGHISFNRTLLGPAGLARTRSLVPVVAQGTSQMMPVLGAIGIELSGAAADKLTSSARLPAAVREAAFLA